MSMFDASEEGEDMFSVFDGSSAPKKRKDVSKENGQNSNGNEDKEEQWLGPDSEIVDRTKRPRKTGFVAVPATKKFDGPANSSAISTPFIAELTETSQTDESNSKDEVISCMHDVCFPPGREDQWDDQIHDPKYPPVQPARTWPFTLDPFQKKSVAILERNESVLVSAHTSAGKTVVAEYAIAKSLLNKQRVIYTSPIKALSNQKYREMYEIFSDVGLMTGDITINPNASCIVMTTEILRSMLYRGSEIVREVAWVIFDEIHYMRDKERGVVWEETIILCPDKVRFVFLSATIPNAKEFASWVAKIHQQPVHVVYTDYRPIPLQHYIFPAGGDGLHLVVDEKGVFREENFGKALSNLTSAPDRKKPNGKNQTKGGSDVYKIVRMIMERNYQPVIVFAFSKKECEALALQMSKLDLNNGDEKKLVEKVFSNAIDSLNEDDKKLPQVAHILPLLKRGIGIHHSGLLPLLKEVIEILFQEGLIKALFATETFSIGLNMPAKTVVFTNVRKFDGANFRWVSGGEYIQMSGRAGRRGLDDRGIVILMVDEKMEPAVAKGMVKGTADPLNSSFYIGYNMLLNLLRIEGMNPEDLLRKSFHQFQAHKALPQSEKKLKELEQERDSIIIRDEDAIVEYYDLKEQLNTLQQGVRDIVCQPIHCVPYLQPGRLVKVKDGDKDWGWGVVVNFQKVSEKGQSLSVDNASARYIVDVLINCTFDRDQNPQPAGPNDQNMFVVPTALKALDSISSVRVYIPKDLRPQENKLSVGKSIKEVIKRFPDGVPLLDPIDDMKIDDPDFKKLVRKLEMIEDKLATTPSFKTADLPQRFDLYKKKRNLDNEIKAMKKQMKISEDVILKQELKGMKRVLRRLGYTNSDDIVEVKGRVACELNAGDEILITELMFAGFFNELPVEQVVASLSCFVFQEKSDENPKLREELSNCFRQLQEQAKRIAKVMQECKLKIEEETYLKQVNPNMMEITLAWCKGAKFSEICQMTDIFEGSIIRSMRRLEELLRELTVAAKAIGNAELEAKFADGITKIKRDIVFAASLYL